MKNKIIPIIAILLLAVLSMSALADVGVGTSPSKYKMSIESGKTHEIQLTIFNTGDSEMDVSMAASGEIAEFTTVSPEKETILPEPKPHEMPVKNGKKITVTFQPPIVKEAKTYTGTISIVGGPNQNSQFGGSVGVATQIELTLLPPAEKPSPITKTHIMIGALVLLLVLIVVLLRKAGLKIGFEKKKK